MQDCRPQACTKQNVWYSPYLCMQSLVAYTYGNDTPQELQGSGLKIRSS